MQKLLEESELITKAAQHLLIVEYAFGTAGNLIHRIIGSNNKYYWDEHINNAYDNTLDPLVWPEKGFRVQTPHKLDLEEQQRTCHTGYCSLFQYNSDITHNIRYLKLAIKNNKKLILRSHQQVPIRQLNDNLTIIRIVGDKLTRKIFTKPPLEKEIHVNTFNLNINNLISPDDITFIKEYTYLCNFLYIEPTVKKVRTFINIWLDKQK
jgi:hypothetical protein